MNALPVDRPDLRLERLGVQHVPALFALTEAHREHLRRWLPWVDETHEPADTRAYVQAVEVLYARSGALQTVLVVDGEVAGVVGQHRLDPSSRSTSIGYWLAADRQGRGLMTSAVRAHLRHAFCDLDLHRVEIRAATGNHRSRAIPERLGFTLEGVLRDAEWVNDRFVDLAVYGLLATCWEG